MSQGIGNKSHASLRVTVGKSRMRKRARTNLCEGRPAMVVPTATTIHMIAQCVRGASSQRANRVG